ncbi:MAG: DNA-directed RNA polymerase subunit beta' [Solirubrobacteraceae bacterium]
MIDINNFDAIDIGLASSKQIRSWSSGEVTKPETINYRTLKPEKDGLFCEKIFGPTKDWECYCGKYKRVRYKGIICERCGVEVTRSKVRRERMGHIDLAAPVSHIWFFKGVPSRIGYLLDMAPKDLEKVLYFAASIVTWVDREARERDLGELQTQVDERVASYVTSLGETLAEIDATCARRVGWVRSGSQKGFTPDDADWSESLEVNQRKLSEEEADRLVADLEEGAASDRSDYVAMTYDAIYRLELAWKGEVVPEDFEELGELLIGISPEQGGEHASRHAEIDGALSRYGVRLVDEAGEGLAGFKGFQALEPKDIITDEGVFRELKDRFGSAYGWGEYFGGGMGAEHVRDLLTAREPWDRDAKPRAVDAERTPGRDLREEDKPGFSLDFERDELEETIRSAKGQKQARAVKRLKVVSAFLNEDAANKPEMMVLEAVPVIPPELRPMVQLDGGRFATSDLNDLYRRVINRNNRLKRLLDLGAPEIIVNNEKRMLQEAVDALFDNGRRGRPVTGPGNRPLKSLSDMLKGKQGRFRQNLLGKRVDYSGRSVIVAGPSLRLHQCGLPKLMALELFKPFIMARLVERKSAQNIKAAKKMVDSMIPEVWDVLEEVIHEHPVLLNRAPTLHRLGIQAFEPVLVEGKAIQVHPLVCHAFNADFDGDQMAVHLPLSAEAQAEARILMLSSNNILSPAHGAPLATPSQDMVLGAYYLTYGPEGEELEAKQEALLSGKWPAEETRPHRYRAAQEAELAYEQGSVGLHDLAEFRPFGVEAGHRLTTVGRIIYNDRIERALQEALGDEFDPTAYEFVNRSMKKRDTTDYVGELVQTYGAGTISQVLDAFKDLGFHFATEAGITISKNDVVIPPKKASILEDYDGRVAELNDQYETGLITEAERLERVKDTWSEATDEVAEAMSEHLDVLNPIYMMANSGARGSFNQIRQLAGMRGLMTNPKGETIEQPIKSNFKEGLSVLEYFISTHGARKGLADTALRTADSGYLTRRLVDVSQDVIIREEDCGTADHIALRLHLDGGALNEQLIGRMTAEPIKTKRGRSLADAAVEIDRELLAQLGEVEELADAAIAVRSTLKCIAATGVCQTCYGRSMATGDLAQIGDAVGIIAAQSIGEPGTQLTMRTFHTGGVALKQDITQGLPRVVELFEARKPKALAVMAPIAGAIGIESDEKTQSVTITPGSGDPETLDFDAHAQLLVEPGEVVEVGRQLTAGSLYPGDILDHGGESREQRRTRTELYLVREVQDVYRQQGVDIHDKHIEIIVRQMLKRVRVLQKGDTDYLPGQFVDRNEFLARNAEVKAAKGKQAEYEEMILGITKASLNTDSFLSAASFQETTKVLTDAALEGKRDKLNGLKENVIIGKLIPAATGLRRYRRIEIEPAEPLPRGIDDGLLDRDTLAEELGLTDAEGLGLAPAVVDQGDLSDLEDLGAGGHQSFAEELAELDVPEPPADER